MMHAAFVQKLRLLVVVLAVVTLQSPEHAHARAAAHRSATVMVARHVLGGSLVRCTSLRQPRATGRPESTHRSARFFAPTSQAVFFAHAGDRCIWRAGAPVHG